MKILALTPEDDPLAELESQLAALHAMGPLEFEAGELEMIAKALGELNRAGKVAIEAMASGQP